MKFTLDYAKYALLARQAAAEGCVLLKNENGALPIQKGEKVSVFGRIQFTYYKSGTGSGGMVNAPYVTGILDGLKACGEISVDEELEAVYKGWIAENPFDMGEGWAQEPWCQKEMPVSSKLAQEAAARSDLAVVILGRTAGEDKDNSAAEGSYLLTKEEEKLLETVCAAFSRTVVVLNVGNVIDMKWVDRYKPQAVLYVWQGGMEGGSGVADVLTGKVNPSGRLSDTIVEDIDDYPSTKHFGDAVRNFYVEDIYVGYRYFETFAKDRVKYPFGFGLSYTDFEVKVTDTATDGLGVRLCVSVKNTGSMAGKEVVQVYVCPPQGRLGKPVRNLIRFGKTTLLPSGEAEDMELSFSLAECVSYDDGGATGHKSCYVLEPGEYGIYVGKNVRDAVLVQKVTVDELQVIKELEEALAPVLDLKRLKPADTAAVDETGEKQFAESWEEVPKRTVDLAERIESRRPKTAAYTGDKGYRLADVCDKKVSMEEFLAQLSDEDLICMTRGEGMCSPKVTPGIAGAFGGVTESLKKFGIPVAGCSDGPSGIRMDTGASAFALPNGTLLACTFNIPLVYELYEMEGMELRKDRIDTLLGPGINIHRNPLNGRNFEYFSEDPYLTGKMAAAQLRGMGAYGVTGTIKHFACNNQEYRRSFVDAAVSERALREIYLKGFEIAVKEGNAYSIMTSYNPINGIWAAGNYDLLTTVLRKEWGYQGVVMTDWWAKMNDEGQEAVKENTTAMVRAQNDVYMVVTDAESNSLGDNTCEGLTRGAITRGELVRNASNICAFLMRSPVLNRFEDREFDVCEEKNSLTGEDLQTETLQEIDVEDEAVLDVSRLSAQKGKSVSYTLNVAQRGVYTLHFKMKSDAGVLAQMSMTVFRNNHLVRTITIHGTEGRWVEEEVEIHSNSLKNYVKLYFGESGIEIGEIRVTKND